MNEKFTVCIGRQYGSGGREVGQLLAQKLGVTCYDKLLIREAARESHLAESYLEQNEERLTDEILPFSGNPFADMADLSGVFYSAGNKTFQAEKRAVETIHDRESAVMIGRCASSILREDPNTLSVFLYAKDGNRIARIGERNNLSERAARERMEKVDRMRRHYFNFYSLSEWGKPESYDILLSTDLGLERCAETIAFLLKSKLEGKSHE